jgi:hypothetical protein
MTVIPFRTPRKAYVIVTDDPACDEAFLTREQAEAVLRDDSLGDEEWRHIEERVISEQEYAELQAEEAKHQFSL